MKFAVIIKASGEPDIDDIIEKHFAEDIELFKRGCEVVAVIDKNVGREDIPGLANIVARFL
ncbi:MAG: hypothetical protein OIN83_07845 [Candidatus Methanoperedens sp.]|nr:hypothetical protein [Candidatus Methanoperedens sp.]